MDLKDTMMLFGVTLGRRRTKREKGTFLACLEGESLPGWKLSRQIGGKGAFRTVNVIAGTPEEAKVLFVVPYDTPVHSLLPRRYYPFHPELNVKEERLDLLTRLLAAVLCLALAYLPVSLALARGGAALLWLLPGAALAAGAFLFLRGWSNRFNFSRASAAVAAAVKLANDLGPRRGAAFAFCDRSISGYEGYKLLRRDLPHLPETVILLDNLAAGEVPVLAFGPEVTWQARDLLSRLPEGTRSKPYDREQLERNLLSVFPRSMVLTCGTVREKELTVYPTGTAKDVAVDMPRLEKLVHALGDFTASRDMQAKGE